MEFRRPKTAGKRLKQNLIKLRQTKNSQYHITLPKGIVEALGHAKGDVYKVVINKGEITLKRVKNAKK